MGLDRVEFIMRLEESFEIRLADADVVGLETPRQFIDFLVEQLRREGRGWTRAKTAEVVHKAIRWQIGLREGEYTDDSRFRDDMGMD